MAKRSLNVCDAIALLIATLSLSMIGRGTPEEFAELIRTDSAKWGEVVRRSGARLD